MIPQPRRHFSLQHRPVRDPAIQTLAGEHAELQLGHIQPGAVFGRVVDLQLVGHAFGLLGGERLIERGFVMGVQIVRVFTYR